MKKTVTPLRSLCAALAALVLLVALAAPAFAADGFADLYYRMNDSAEVLTEDEDGELEASLEELSVRQSFDVIIATIDSLESEGCTSMEEYADDLYDYCQFGYGENRDGVLLVIGLITALIVTGVMKSRLKSVAPQRDATSYVRQGSMKLTNQRDLYLYREIHRTERPKETDSGSSGGSSTHTSSSGSTHGGGGGSF